MPAAPRIELRRVGKRFGDRWAVEDVSLAVARGELLAVVGASGSGKTTTLKTINRLVEPDAGEVLVDGRAAADGPAWALRRRIGYVFQGIGLFPHLSVAANVGATPSLLGWPPAEIRRRVDELLALVELEPGEYRERLPAELSGGQRQRVGLARALAARPEALLLDEPFGALDPLTRQRLEAALDRIRRELGLTAVLVTHDLAEALLLADRIAVLDSGRLVQLGPPEELLRRPADDRVARLLEAPMRQAAAISESLDGRPLPPAPGERSA